MPVVSELSKPGKSKEDACTEVVANIVREEDEANFLRLELLSLQDLNVTDRGSIARILDTVSTTTS